MSTVARSDSEGLSLGYRIGYRIRYLPASSARPNWATARTRTPGCDERQRRSRRRAGRGSPLVAAWSGPGHVWRLDRACADARSFAFCSASTSSAFVIIAASLT